jgi:ABC-type bacteriocin/lantibiotic exporter with double-glycine peptidase domain
MDWKEEAGVKARPFLLMLALVLISCAGSPYQESRTAARMIRGVPFYPQEDYQCGPASLAGVLNYRGLKISPEEIAREIFSPRARGTLDMDLVFYAQRKGFSATRYRGGWEDLRKNIDSDAPLIVMVDAGFWLYQKNHFMVAVGYDPEGLIANSGQDRHKFIPRDVFLRAWKRTKFWTLRIVPQ